MEFVKLEGQVEKELYEMCDAVASVVEGLASGQNAFGAVLSSLQKLNLAVENAKLAVEGLKSEPGAAVLAGGFLAKRIIDAVAKKV